MPYYLRHSPYCCEYLAGGKWPLRYSSARPFGRLASLAVVGSEPQLGRKFARGSLESPRVYHLPACLCRADATHLITHLQMDCDCVSHPSSTNVVVVATKLPLFEPRVRFPVGADLSDTPKPRRKRGGYLWISELRTEEMGYSGN